MNSISKTLIQYYFEIPSWNNCLNLFCVWHFIWSITSLSSWQIASDFNTFFFRQFHFCVIISLWKRAGSLISTNLNSLYLRMFCVKFGWNWFSDYGEEDENVKNLQTDEKTEKQTDNRQQTIRKAYFSFQLRCVKNDAPPKYST